MPFPAPTIILQPKNVTTTAGKTVEFVVIGGRNSPKTFGWRKVTGGAPPAGATLSYCPTPQDRDWTGLPDHYVPVDNHILVYGNKCKLTIPSVTEADLGTYSIIIFVPLEGNVESDAAALFIDPPDTSGGTPAPGADPVITSQPPDLEVPFGTSADLPVTATGTAPLTYQWSRLAYPHGTVLTDGALYSGTTTATLTISSVDGRTGGFYFCTVTGAAGSAISRNIGVVAANAVTPGSGGGIGNPVYSAAASAFAAFFGGVFSTEGVYFDGDFDTARPDGMMWPEFPFASEGDSATVICKQRWMQRAQLFTPTALGTAYPTNASLFLLDETDFKHEGGGVVSWIRTYATLPAARDVFESYSYGFQFVQSSGENVKLAETAFEVTSRVRCEYFHVRDRASFPPKLAPRYLQLADKTFVKRGEGDLAVDGTYHAFMVSTDAEILAEDSKERVWKYPFMERRSRLIAGPTLGFWGDAINFTPPTLPPTS